MKKSEVCEVIREIGIIPAIRVSSAEDAHYACDVVASGGIPIVEITMTVPEAVELIAHLVRHHETILVGAGTVLNTDMASKCLDSGAHFLTSPGLNLKIVEFAAKREIAVLPGALTPTEVMEAWDAGSDFIKVFPCVDVGGARYIKALKTSLPQIPLIAAGGVTQQTAANFILAGATAIGVGTELIPADAIANRETERIRELAHRFLGFVKDARHRLTAHKESDSTAKTDFWKFHKHAKSDRH
jgi:2-dehydro-3-deoxyphosphogluconate aldolase / (4S)-4-hydroxy-2-oxoglutarate aldolase